MVFLSSLFSFILILLSSGRLYLTKADTTSSNSNSPTDNSGGAINGNSPVSEGVNADGASSFPSAPTTATATATATATLLRTDTVSAFETASISHLSSSNFKFSDVTIVTSCFDIMVATTPHTEADKRAYLRLASALSQLETNMIVFTSVTNAPILRVLRGNKPTLFISYSNESAIPVFERSEPIVSQSTSAYLTGLATPWFLAQAALANLFRSKYFVYVDLYQFPDDQLTAGIHNWPSVEKFDAITERYQRNDLLYFPSSSVPESCLSSDGSDAICNRETIPFGGLFWGTPAALETHFHTFTTLVNHFYSQQAIFQDDNHVLQQLFALVEDNYRILPPITACDSTFDPIYLAIAEPSELTPECRLALEA